MYFSNSNKKLLVLHIIFCTYSNNKYNLVTKYILELYIISSSIREIHQIILIFNLLA